MRVWLSTQIRIERSSFLGTKGYEIIKVGEGVWRAVAYGGNQLEINIYAQM